MMDEIMAIIESIEIGIDDDYELEAAVYWEAIQRIKLVASSDSASGSDTVGVV